MKKMIAALLTFILLMGSLLGGGISALAEADDEYTRARELGFVSDELASLDPDSAITWKQFCEMAGRMIETYDASALPAWQELTANAPDTPMKRDGGMMSLLFAAKAINLHTFNAHYPELFAIYSEHFWDIVTMDYPVFPFNDPIDLGEGVSCVCHVGPSYDYCLRRVSPVSGKALLDWEGNDLRLEQDFTIREAAQAILRLYESGTVTEMVEPEYVEPEYTTPELLPVPEDIGHFEYDEEILRLEYQRAVDYGFIPEEWLADIDAGMTEAEFCHLVDLLVEKVNPEGMDLWLEVSAMARVSNEPMLRDSAAIGLLYASQAMNCCFQNVYEYPDLLKADHNPNSWIFRSDEDIAVWPQLPADYPLWTIVPGRPDGTCGAGGIATTTIATAFYYTLMRVSSVTEYPVLLWDENYNMRMYENITRKEAVAGLWRLIESTPNLLEDNHYIHISEVGTYDQSIITDELLSKQSNLPVPTHTSLPSNWNGSGISKYKDRCYYREFRETEVAFLAEHGFNFARIFFGFNSLRYPDYPEDSLMVNEAELKDLDQLIAWGIQHDVHIQISMCETPNSHSYYSFGEDEWEYIRAYWKALARRYAGIPSKYLSFDLMNEYEPNRYDPEEMQVGITNLGLMVAEVRAQDPDRVLLCSFNNNPGSEWMETVAKLGLSMGIHPGYPGYLTSGSGDIVYVYEEPNWPFPYFAEVLRKGDAITVTGDIGGNTLWLGVHAVAPCTVAFDNGESVTFEVEDFMAPREFMGNQYPMYSGFRGHDIPAPMPVQVPQGVEKLTITAPNDDILFSQIGMESDIASHWHTAHDLGTLRSEDSNSFLHWDDEYGWTSEKYCSPEYIYELCMEEPIRYAQEYQVGYMVNEIGTHAVDCGWDVSLKVNHDGDMIAMFEELGISWSLNEIEYFTENYDDPYGWENGTWETNVYTFDSGLRQTFTHSVEVLDMYKSFFQDRENRNAEDETAAAAKVPLFYEESTVGSKGYHVQILQQALIEQGYLSDKADGIFGNKTAAAIKNAQAAFGLEQTGVADEAFLKALYANL